MNCVRCNHSCESTEQCLWDCIQTWQVLDFMAYVPLGGQRSLSIGFHWMVILGWRAMEIWRGRYDHGWLLYNSTILLVTLSQRDIGHPDVDEQQDMISSLTIWFIWKEKCKEVFLRAKGKSYRNDHEGLAGNRPHFKRTIWCRKKIIR